MNVWIIYYVNLVLKLLWLLGFHCEVSLQLIHLSSTLIKHWGHGSSWHLGVALHYIFQEGGGGRGNIVKQYWQYCFNMFCNLYVTFKRYYYFYSLLSQNASWKYISCSEAQQFKFVPLRWRCVYKKVELCHLWNPWGGGGVRPLSLTPMNVFLKFYNLYVS